MQKSISYQAADNIRILAASMVEKANSGHPGGPMGGADFMHILYSEYLKFDPENPFWFQRDRFYLDPGHMSAMLYSQLALTGHMSIEELKQFRQWKSPTPGHPELDIKRGIENTSGPLGLGHAFGVGSAIAERFLHARFGDVISHKTYIYISDGGIQEEISQGVGRIAGTLGLGNVIIFYDANDVQLSSKVSEISSEDTALKYEALGWHVIKINGNDHDQIRKALDESIQISDKPSLIIGETVMGKGVVDADGKMIEGRVEFHGKPLGKSSADFAKTIIGLGGNPENPFAIFDEVQKHYNQILNEKRKQVSYSNDMFDQWQNEYPEKATHLDDFINQRFDVDWKSMALKPNDATRNASGLILSQLSEFIPNLIVSSADLSVSDKTQSFLEKTTHFVKEDFTGAFLQAGVSELSMAALCTGMALHGGVLPVCATFFAFSDYMKPVLRVAALMEQKVIFLWTHDAFRVGEDGPTHQPVEQEAQLRLLEKLQNHSGKNSFMALRPADSFETLACWQMAIKNPNGPSGLILSRQNISDLPSMDRMHEAFSASYGGYVVKECEDPDVILVANGSEVATLFEAGKILETKGIKYRVCSFPSEGVFDTQSSKYKNTVLSDSVPKFGLTAGLPVNLIGLVGNDGCIHGLSHFGYSAPYTVLDEKFGFTPEAVADKIIHFLNPDQDKIS